MTPEQNLSTVKMLEPGLFEHETRVMLDEGPTLEQIERVRLENSIRHKGFSDGRLMKFRAQIPAWRVWEAEHLLGFNLSDKRDFRKYLMLHPEYIVSPEDTGHSGRIIVKGD